MNLLESLGFSTPPQTYDAIITINKYNTFLDIEWLKIFKHILLWCCHISAIEYQKRQ